MMKIAFMMAALFLVGALAFVPASEAQGLPSAPHVYAYSSGQGSQDLFVQANQSGMEMFENWTFAISGTGNYAIEENGSTIASGFSSGSVEIGHRFNQSTVSAVVVFNGISYTFTNETIVNFLSPVAITTVSVISYMPGQAEFLAVQPGQTHDLMYRDWTAYLETSREANYTILDNGKVVASGSVFGSRSVYFNVSEGGATVLINVGGKAFSFPQELIASVPLQQYYGHQAPVAQYTLSQYMDFGIHILMDALIVLIFSILSVGSWVISRKNRKVMRMR
jgi:hypothetical protein